jgi:hypothetical protein
MRLRPLALFILTVATTLAVSLCGCCCCCVAPPTGGEPRAPASTEFGNPVSVTILGYDGDAMEPFISRDGTLLLFNNRNDPAVDTNLHYARRINDTAFQYGGEIAGVNSDALEGVASMDRDGNLYFTTTRSYDTTLSTIHTARYTADGRADGVAIVEGISKKKAPWLNMDSEISADGQRLYYTDNEFDPNAGLPKTSDIFIAEKTDAARFQPLPGSGAIMKNVNTALQEYAMATSADELELYFTRADFDKQDFRIMVAKRNGTAEPFGREGCQRRRRHGTCGYRPWVRAANCMLRFTGSMARRSGGQHTARTISVKCDSRQR